MNSAPRNIFMLGVGGMGMTPLALWLARAGFRITGHDDALSPFMRRLLETAGITIASPAPEAIREPFSLAARSSAVSEEHPLCRQLQAGHATLLRRGELLARSLQDKKLLAVAGSHGKTTTTAFLIHVLERAGLDFGYLLGGLFRDPDRLPARWSEAPWVVAEIDESDGTIDQFNPEISLVVNLRVKLIDGAIDQFNPEISLVVNLDWDHNTRYATQEALDATFEGLFRRTCKAVIIPAGCPRLRRLAQAASCPVYTFGAEGTHCASFLEPLRALGAPSLILGKGFAVEGEKPVEVPVPGPFNALNALAALAAAGAILDKLPEQPFSGFSGVRRRQDFLFSNTQLQVVSDYAHHPAEIHALLGYFRKAFPGRLTAVFEPHRYSRTKQYYSEFARELAVADHVVLLPVYAASEMPLPGADSAAICRAFLEGRDLSAITLLESSLALNETLGAQVEASRRNGEFHTVLFIGAGSVASFAENFVEKVRGSLQTFPVVVKPAISPFESLRGLHPETVLRANEPLAEKTTLRTGGPALYYAEPATAEDLYRLIQASREASLPFFLLGRGSNLIIPDEGYPGLMVRLSHESWRQIEFLPEGCIRAGSGARLKEICGQACRAGLAGFEFMEGIPGSLGGALRMNAGAMGGWISEVLASIELLTPEGEIRSIPREKFNFAYRECRELQNAMALGALLEGPSREASESIRNRMESFAKHRRATQPREPSAGCTFRNPPGSYAGKLIDSLGLRGLRHGAAEVSAVHANFIINTGGASSSDVLTLLQTVRERVQAATGIALEPEVIVPGKTWEQLL